MLMEQRLRRPTNKMLPRTLASSAAAICLNSLLAQRWDGPTDSPLASPALHLRFSTSTPNPLYFILNCGPLSAPLRARLPQQGFAASTSATRSFRTRSSVTPNLKSGSSASIVCMRSIPMSKRWKLQLPIGLKKASTANSTEPELASRKHASACASPKRKDPPMCFASICRNLPACPLTEFRRKGTRCPHSPPLRMTTRPIKPPRQVRPSNPPSNTPGHNISGRKANIGRYGRPWILAGSMLSSPLSTIIRTTTFRNAFAPLALSLFCVRAAVFRKITPPSAPTYASLFSTPRNGPGLQSPIPMHSEQKNKQTPPATESPKKLSGG